MQPSNGNLNGSRATLDTVKQLVDQLQAELKRQEQELQQLRAERDNYRALVTEYLKEKYSDPKEWSDFDPKDCSVTMADMLAEFRAK